MRMKYLSDGVNINDSSPPIVRGTELRVRLSSSSGVDRRTCVLDRPIHSACNRLLGTAPCRKVPGLHDLLHVHHLIVGLTRILHAQCQGAREQRYPEPEAYALLPNVGPLLLPLVSLSVVRQASMALLFDIQIETISMICLVLSIGFSIDNVVHYCHAYMTSSKPSRKEKVTDALERIGMPILAGDLSTILALLVLLASASRIFKSFFWIILTVLFLGAVHAVVLLPVVLGLLGPLTSATPPAPAPQPETIVCGQGTPKERDSGGSG